MRLFLLSLLLLCLQTANAQEPSEKASSPCGTPPGIAPFLKAYHSNPNAFITERSSDTLLAGMQLHLLAKDNGIGRISTERLLDAFCQLNEDFAASNIRFYSKYDWNLIDSTAWYQHDSLDAGIDMMLTNNVPDALNIYFVTNPADNCGYNLPYAGIAIKHGCAGANSHTWSHEIGHALSLPHPFIGWEGKVYSPLNPTPDTLTYDYTHFHATPDLVNAPLDTALTEYVDGSNCTIAADLICDTPPDYLSYGWDCDDLNRSYVLQNDRNGASFRSDGSLIMSYAFDHCQNRFSDEEIAIMRATLLTEKQAWLTTEQAEPDLAGPATLLYPINQQYVSPVNTLLQWSAVPGATHYLIQASLLQSYIAKEIDVVVTDTNFMVPALSTNKKYFWRVRPFNDWSSCVPFTANGIFHTTDIVSATEPDSEGWRCYPSLLSAGQMLTLELPETWLQHPVQYTVYDAAGRMMWQNNISTNDLKMYLNLPNENWPAGVYRLVAVGEKGVKTHAIIKS
ncbi:MAG: hypothetical protein IT262_19100 [Saprospiraceae bacterium]|nr:hypothetical protein [Saprospiraceae bacterium]